MKLFKVYLRGMRSSVTGPAYGESYVVAPDSQTAYQTVRGYLDEKDMGFSHDRAMRSVELLAEEGDYPECKTILFLSKEARP